MNDHEKAWQNVNDGSVIANPLSGLQKGMGLMNAVLGPEPNVPTEFRLTGSQHPWKGWVFRDGRGAERTIVNPRVGITAVCVMSGWAYGMYTHDSKLMVHGPTCDDIIGVANDLAEALGTPVYEPTHSVFVKEFKPKEEE